MRSVLRTALRPRWWPRHLLLVVIVAGFCFLGHWQWDVSVSPRGSLQNTLYAFQWWAMALIVIYGWWRLLYEEAHPERRPRPAGGAGEPPGIPSGHPPTPAAPAEAATDGGTWMFPVPNAPDEEDDEELAAYNAYLARLNARADARR
ncbi:MAG: hypothetical protein K6T37_08770 [Acidothermus cellulolyticus]|nr:hypothetical protein [Acidothermus cellulolyticus]